MIARARSFFLPERGVLRPAPYAVIVAITIGLAILLMTTGPGQRLEWSVYDAFMRMTTRANEPAPDVVVVAIDELSFREIGLPWPWPRAMHAQLIETIAEQKPASIAFDIIFDVPGASPEGDVALAEAIRAAGNVVLAVDRAVVDDRGYSVTQWTEPIPPLAEAAAGLGYDRVPLDPDGLMRHAIFGIEDRPSLPVAALARAGVASPANPDEQRLFRFNGPPRRGIVTASYYQALDAANSLPRGFFTAKHVFIGRSLDAPAANEADHFQTPVALQMAGVEIHATIADAILRNRFIADPLDSLAALAVLCVLLAAVVAAIAYKLPPGVASVAAVAAAAIVFGSGYALFVYADTRIPVMAPIVVIGAAYGAAAAYRFTLTNRERRLIKRAFANYVAPAIVEQMLKDPSKLKLGGEEYEVTVLFSDLEGFTTLSERVTPHELTTHLTGYFRSMINGLLVQRGTLDKLIGDAIMMYFGCPIPDSEHPLQACRGALEMQRRMIVLNDAWQREGLPVLRTRIGINTGRAIAGNMGTDTIFNYTILGDCVNLASRLEGVNKEYGTLIILGEDTWERVSDHFEARELDWIRVKGKEKPVAIYELACEKGQLDAKRRQVFDLFAQGLAAYRDARWEEASARFSAVLEIDPADGPSLTFAARCAEYTNTGTPARWDGVYVMHSK